MIGSIFSKSIHLLILISVFSCLPEIQFNNQHTEVLELTDILSQEKYLIELINNKFNPAGINAMEMMSPYNIDRMLQGNNYFFCGQPIKEMWGKANDSTFVLFLALDSTFNFYAFLDSKFGKTRIESSSTYSIGSSPGKSEYINWEIGNIDLYNVSFSKFSRYPSFQNCKLFIVSNKAYPTLFNFSNLKEN